MLANQLVMVLLKGRMLILKIRILLFELRMRFSQFRFFVLSSVFEYQMLILEFRMRRFEGLGLLPNLNQFVSDARGLWRGLLGD